MRPGGQWAIAQLCLHPRACLSGQSACGQLLDTYPANRDAFVTLLNNRNVETLFTGHTHYYEHDVAPEYPLGNLDQITNGSMRSGDDDNDHLCACRGQYNHLQGVQLEWQRLHFA